MCYLCFKFNPCYLCCKLNGWIDTVSNVKARQANITSFYPNRTTRTRQISSSSSGVFLRWCSPAVLFRVDWTGFCSRNFHFANQILDTDLSGSLSCMEFCSGIRKLVSWYCSADSHVQASISLTNTSTLSPQLSALPSSSSLKPLPKRVCTEFWLCRAYTRTRTYTRTS